ncbi:MAG: hypothetical protein IH945_02210 [Armatimonadetes bacterium]|nr:hypothetical protein [Armatimonadota bacterium]
MSCVLALDHPAVVALVRAHHERAYPKGEVVGATGVLERDPNGMVNATDSVSSARLTVGCGWAGEVHLDLARPEQAERKERPKRKTRARRGRSAA